jgi:hypothetical protein
MYRIIDREDGECVQQSKEYEMQNMLFVNGKVQKEGAWAPGGKLLGKLLFHASHEKVFMYEKIFCVEVRICRIIMV